MNTPFLRQVIDLYTSNEHDRKDLPFYCFVTPSRRGARFMRRYLHHSLDALGKPAFEPRFISMAELLAAFNHGVEPSPQEQMCILYNAYLEVLERHGQKNTAYTYDKFRFWGNLILNDFEDIDKSMADAHKVFTNLSRLKEIQSNFLTHEQLEVIRQYWRVEEGQLPVADEDDDTFWRHVKPDGTPEGSPTRQFMRIWELLDEIYTLFRERLQQSKPHFVTAGMAYRHAAEVISEMPAEKFRYRKYVFVGFNVLSTAEITILKHLQRIGKADFYWDMSSPAFFANSKEMIGYVGPIQPKMINWANSATRFVARNAMAFPSAKHFPWLTDHQPHIEITSMPSATGQAKFAGRQLEQWIKDGYIADPTDAINTAVIVNDEAILMPVLHSIPDQLEKVNLSFGLPRRHTAPSALLNIIINLQLKRRQLHGTTCFFYEDVQAILQHPWIQAIYHDEACAINKSIYDKGYFNYPASELENTRLGYIFAAPKHDDPNGVFNYVTKIIDTLIEELGKDLGDITEVERNIALLRVILEEVKELQHLMTKYHITVTDNTYIHLVRNLANAGTLNYIGEPLQGLQVLGMTETRSIDFDNVILLNMNERIFPRRNYAGSFIPNNLRAAYQLPTLAHRDSMAAYAFYRLLSRASRVSICYDTRTKDVRWGQQSRYVHQLKKLDAYTDVTGYNIDHLASVALPEDDVTRPKTQDQLAPFLQGTKTNQQPRYLSASALKKYMQCPMRFYFEKIVNLRDDVELTDMMDDVTYGSAIHKALEDFYNYLKANGQATVTASILDDACNPNHTLYNQLYTFLRRGINKEFNRIPLTIKLANGNEIPNPALDNPLSGHPLLLEEITMSLLCSLLQREKDYAPFTFVGAEFELKGPWTVEPGLTINFTGSIDRIDLLPAKGGEHERLRFIDYKTGKDHLTVQEVEGLFNGKHEKQAIFQLMTYALAYEDMPPKPMQHPVPEGGIMPQIFLLKDVRKTPIPLLRANKQPLLSHYDIEEQFREKLVALLRELFDVNQPWKKCDAKLREKRCKRCPFTRMCGEPYIEDDPMK